MQTDSLLTAWDRALLKEWADKGWDYTPRIASEIERLEQENQRLADELANADANVRVLSDCRELDEYFRTLRTEWKAKKADLATTRDALTAARAEVQRLRGELEANPATEDVIAERTRLRAENQQLRENAEKDQTARVEWQATIDGLEAENAKLRQTLRLALTLSEPYEVDRVMERISTLEGRVQGITEIVKQELAIIVERVKALEALQRPREVPLPSASSYDPRTARNPFEDLRPPRGL